MFAGYRPMHRIVRTFASSSMSSTDCYTALGIPIGSGSDAVKTAYRKLVKVHHPDLGGSTDRFLRIQNAYENLMDSGSASSTSSKSSSPGSRPGSTGYWKSWDTDSTWWSSKYSSEDDFEANFEEQWRKFTRSTEGRTRRTKQRVKEELKPLQCDKIFVSCQRFPKSSILGEYEKIAQFNGKQAYHNKECKYFLFWSNKSKDWKISSRLKDDGSVNCAAFTDRINPSAQSPFFGLPTKWMVWNDKGNRYVPASLLGKDQKDYSEWTVAELRAALQKAGYSTEEYLEKSELIAKLRDSAGSSGSSSSSATSSTSSTSVFQLCSRQRHDQVIQNPPVLSASCNVGKNRVDKFNGPIDDLESWLLKNGDRRRLYGVYDSENSFCFCLIWKDNKNWVRAGPYDF